MYSGSADSIGAILSLPPSPRGTFEPQKIFLVVPAQECGIGTVDGGQMFLKSSRAQESPHQRIQQPAVPPVQSLRHSARGWGEINSGHAHSPPSWSSPSGGKTATVQIRRSACHGGRTVGEIGERGEPAKVLMQLPQVTQPEATSSGGCLSRDWPLTFSSPKLA